MVKIVNKNHPALRAPAQPVNPSWFGSAKLKKVVTDMSRALATQKDGVALAAPQIGLSLQIFVVSGRILSTTKDDPQTAPASDLVFINPKITRLSKTKQDMEEGCLSVRWFYGQVRRATKATIEAHNLDGKKFSYSGSGLMAQIFQHETDHLNGVLFTDKAKKLRQLKPVRAKHAS